MDQGGDVESTTSADYSQRLSSDGTILDIRSMGREDVMPSIPAEQLNHVQQLCARNNSIKMLPMEFGIVYSSLLRLDLSRNKLTSLDDCGLDRLIFLQYLDISWNFLEVITAEICKLLSLRELHARNNELRGISERIEDLAGLQVLNLNSNKLTRFPIQMEGLNKLEICSLHGNPIDEDMLSPLMRVFYMKDKVLRSKGDRRKAVQRALHIRAAVKRRMQEEIATENARIPRKPAGSNITQEQQQHTSRARARLNRIK